MSEEVVVLKTFNNEIEAEMAQQVLQEASVTAFVSKMMPEVWSLSCSELMAFVYSLTVPTPKMHT